MLNDVAYYFAVANVDLAGALEYAQQAVDRQEKVSLDVTLSKLLPEDLACTRKIGMFWGYSGMGSFSTRPS